MDSFFEDGLLYQEGATTGARVSMPVIHEVILTEDYQTGIAVLDSTSNRNIGEYVEIRWGWRQVFEAKKYLSWNDYIFSLNWYDDYWYGGGLPHWGLESCSQERSVRDNNWGLTLS